MSLLEKMRKDLRRRVAVPQVFKVLQADATFDPMPIYFQRAEAFYIGHQEWDSIRYETEYSPDLRMDYDARVVRCFNVPLYRVSALTHYGVLYGPIRLYD